MPSVPTSSKNAEEESKRGIDKLDGIAEDTANLSYVGVIPVQDATGNSNQFPGLFSITPKATMGLALGLDIPVAVLSFISALRLLTKESDYRQTQNKLKAALNLFSSTQIMALSYNPLFTSLLALSAPTGLAGIAFAVGTACDFANACVDFSNAWKESMYEGWLEERRKEKLYFEGLDAIYTKKLADLNQKKATLEAAIQTNPTNEYLKKYYTKKINSLETLITRTNDKKLSYDLKLKKINADMECRVNVAAKTATQAEIDADKYIQEEMDRRLKDNGTNLFIKGMSFVGMTCLAISPFILFCPPAAIALAVVGMALTTLVAAHCVTKNASRIGSGIVSFCSLFKPIKVGPPRVIAPPTPALAT